MHDTVSGTAIAAPGLLSLYEVAARLKVDPRTVLALVHEEGLPALRLRRHYRFDEQALQHWMAQRAVGRTKS